MHLIKLAMPKGERAFLETLMDTPGLKSVIAKVKMSLEGLHGRSEQGSVKADQKPLRNLRNQRCLRKSNGDQESPGQPSRTPADVGREYQEEREERQERVTNKYVII